MSEFGFVYTVKIEAKTTSVIPCAYGNINIDQLPQMLEGNKN